MIPRSGYPALNVSLSLSPLSLSPSSHLPPRLPHPPPAPTLSYAVFEVMETDLASIIKSPQPLGEEHVQFFMYQILRGIKYIHSRHIIHRDLKPRNLLVNSNCDLKICDFGLARMIQGGDGDTRGVNMTDYVATRWYRSPEILLSWSQYTMALDMWSVGCILAELLTRSPLLPGNDSQVRVVIVCEGYVERRGVVGVGGGGG